MDESGEYNFFEDRDQLEGQCIAWLTRHDAPKWPFVVFVKDDRVDQAIIFGGFFGTDSSQPPMVNDTIGIAAQCVAEFAESWSAEHDIDIDDCDVLVGDCSRIDEYGIVPMAELLVSTCVFLHLENTLAGERRVDDTVAALDEVPAGVPSDWMEQYGSGGQ